MFDFNGKVVLVSGVGRGLGRSVATTVLAGGGSVVLGDLDGPPLAAFASELEPTGRVAFAQCDITDQSSCSDLAALAQEQFGRLDAIVNVAAYSAAVGGLMDGDLHEWEHVSGVNVKGTLQMTKAAVPLLRTSGGGSIVIIGSVAAIHSVEGVPQILYGASKAGLVAATHYLARELAGDRIRVNTISPGWKWGAVLDETAARWSIERGISVESIRESVRSQHPLGRYTTDQEVANAVAFFCSDLAPSITGQVLYIDGGMTA